MTNIIHIVGASGAGTTTLGQALEREYGYKWLDTDGFFWMPTDPPFVKSLPHEERVKLLTAAMEEHPKCVISGSLCGWGDAFIPKFDLVIFVDTPTDIRIKRLERREFERFGERIRKGGDMYENHVGFIEWAKSYDTNNPPERCRKLHEEWFEKLSYPLLRVDGTKPVDKLAGQIRAGGYLNE
ncbi:MAG TPA: shikimate kinase [Ruminococcaceae bacterium]|nr:shikimate kinase [Oscillospiraceae bacterium]